MAIGPGLAGRILSAHARSCASFLRAPRCQLHVGEMGNILGTPIPPAASRSRFPLATPSLSSPPQTPGELHREMELRARKSTAQRPGKKRRCLAVPRHDEFAPLVTSKSPHGRARLRRAVTRFRGLKSPLDRVSPHRPRAPHQLGNTTVTPSAALRCPQKLSKVRTDTRTRHPDTRTPRDLLFVIVIFRLWALRLTCRFRCQRSQENMYLCYFV